MGIIKFIREDEGDESIEVTIPSGVTCSDVFYIFKRFMLCCGYVEENIDAFLDLD